MTRAAARAVRAAAPIVALTVAAAALTGCGASPAPQGPAGIDGLTIPTPSPDPSDFAVGTQNRWFPLEPGTRWTYRQDTPTGHREVIATVLARPHPVDGVSTAAVRWQVTDQARTRTAMVRWYAVDGAGNVWWFGQRVLPRGEPLDKLAPRSWLAGRDGAEAGLVLSATPRRGDGYANAREPLVVARRSTVLGLTGTVTTADRTFHDTVVTRDLSSLAPLHTVQTYYGRGLGMVAQEDTTATSITLSLVRVRRG
jgi:hypothetical protein